MGNVIIRLCFLFSILFGLLHGCKKKPETLFQLLPPEETGIDFINAIEETDSFNILSYEYIYNGGGVGVSDFNNDGKQDIFFTGNQVGNKLYINEGEFRFKDITSEANVNVQGRWNSGVSVVDINNDGWKDIYICATMKTDSLDRRNMLFINNGLNQNGVPTFTDKAADYNLDDMGFSVNAAFFDYDRDGDLDVYVLTNEKLTNYPTNYRLKIIDGSSPNNDRLYRNNGDFTFSNVSNETGITIEGFGLGLAISDFNKDGWPDIYVSNDYLSNDILYINQKDGTFKNRITDYIGHQSQFSMGNDAADINNDGMPEIITLDMLPEISIRKKTTIGNKTYQNYINNKEFGYEYQYVRNMLHLNNGLDKEIKFSEVGQLSGVYQTEWSWSPLFADFDNDGKKDLFITNGFPRDITDKDFALFRADKENIAGARYLLDSIPVVKISNYAYKNEGDLVFSDVTKSWGLDNPSFSNGAAFADFDNDGDLDYVVNNINEVALVYRNTLDPLGAKQDHSTSNFLRVSLTGSSVNNSGIGSKITLYYDSGKMQYNEQSIYRGFLSTVENISHFGVGASKMVDSILVEWPDGKVQMVENIKTNQVVSIDYKLAVLSSTIIQAAKNSLSLFKEVSKETGVLFKHLEDDKIDFNLQRTMPHKFSQAGPGICVGDINNDGFEDIVVGGSSNYHFVSFLQKTDGTFSLMKDKLSTTLDGKDESKKEEDEGLLLFDADNDNDLDLYIVSGSLEDTDVKVYQDRLYKNDGKGNFTLDVAALPEITASGSCVRAADFDADGDLDLFVGGRVVPASYPLAAKSYILKNNGGRFIDVTDQMCPDLRAPGMVTDAIWSDFDNDGKVDLILVGEFMPFSFFKNEGIKFNKHSSTGIEQFIGWWNSISSGDFDKDGDTDYIGGNLGLNNNYQVSEKYPISVYAKDFDGNGSIDPILACYMRESMTSDVKKLYPVHFWDEINSQSTKFRRNFSNYKKYGEATLETLFTKADLEGALILKANHMASSYVENMGGGKFQLRSLPTSVQVGPVNGMVSEDVNADGNLDIVMIGNDYGNEVFAGRYDGFTGLILVGDGKGFFEVIPTSKSGFYVSGDAKALAKISTGNKELLIATQNKDSLKVFAGNSFDSTEIFTPQVLDSWAEFIYSNGERQRTEFYYGNGYLSQSSRQIAIPKDVIEVLVYDYMGTTRSVFNRNQ
jgi:enediyne biosynthesis protein E4